MKAALVIIAILLAAHAMGGSITRLGGWQGAGMTSACIKP